MVEKYGGTKSPRVKFSEQEIDALVEARMTSPCLLPGRWLTVIIGGEKLFEEEIRHIGSCRHCQRHRKQWKNAAQQEH